MARTKHGWSIFAEAFRLSISPQCLAVAVSGLLATTLCWQLVGTLLRFADDDDLARVAAVQSTVTNATCDNSILSSVLPGGVQEKIAFSLPTTNSPIDPIVGVPYRLTEPFRQLFVLGGSWLTWFYFLLGGLLSVAIWSVCGGAIARVAVSKYALNENLPLRDAIRFGVRRGLDIFLAATLPVLATALMAIPLIVVGWLMRFDAGVLLAGLVWPFAIATAVLMAVLCLGLLFGWPLMWGTIASEDSDAFDAISRSYGYTFQRPLHYLAYAVVAAVLGLLGWLLAWWFSEAVIALSLFSVELGCGADRLAQIRLYIAGSPTEAAPGAMLSSGTNIMRLSIDFVRSVASAFSFSFFWCVSSAIYLLLRRDTDQTDMDDVVFSVHQDSTGQATLPEA